MHKLSRTLAKSELSCTLPSCRSKLGGNDQPVPKTLSVGEEELAIPPPEQNLGQANADVSANLGHR